MASEEKKTTCILHLSDLHFGTTDNAEMWQSQISEDLKLNLNCEKLDVLIISGDIANFSVEAEYEAAAAFLRSLQTEFSLKPDQIVMAPGNHDLNWGLAKKGYSLMDRVECEDRLEEGNHIPVGDDVVRLRDEEKYKARFRIFSEFYQGVKGEPYPLEYANQGMLHHFPAHNLLVLGLNSAWNLDHHFTKRAGIHAGALTRALDKIRKTPAYAACHKMAVWHHPMASKAEDRIADDGFMQRLALCGFGICLHGHIHKVDQNLYRYDMNPDGRKIEIVGAGTFGAPVKEWTPGYPLQYNFLTLEGRTLTVNTRCRQEINGAWDADYQWRHGDGKQPWYEIALPEVEIAARPTDEPDHEIPLEIPTVYRKWVRRQCGLMDIERLREKGRVIQVNLPELFIPLYAYPPGREDAGDRKTGMPGEKAQAVDIEDLMRQNPYLLIEGQAGSGKTTLMKHFAHAALSDENGNDFLPVLIFLKDFNGADLDMADRPPGEALAEDILTAYFRRTQNGLDADMVSRFCKAGKAVFLIDGLDEIDRAARNRLAEAFAVFREQRGEPRMVFSGRPHGVAGAVVDRFGKRHVKILSLNMAQAETFIDKWFCHVSEEAPEVCKKTSAEMLAEMKDHPAVDELKDTPLMLTAICLLYHDSKELPGQRAELYKKFIEYLLYRRFDDPPKVWRYLMHLAHDMHAAEKRVADKLPSVRLLSSIYARGENESDDDYFERLEGIFDRVEADCGVMKFNNGRYEFWHLTFQEFLTAAALVNRERENFYQAIRKYWDNPWYKEVVQLYVGYLSIQNIGMANGIVQQVLKEKDEKPFNRWRLAALSFKDIHESCREDEVRRLVEKRLFEITASDADYKDRAEAGDILGRLGDPRNLKEFLLVKGGKYALSQGMIDIDSFEMGKYPVTNGWFREFIEAGGYATAEFWSPQGRAWLKHTGAQYPRYWYDRQWNCPNAPVVGVTWWEADAFILWLTEMSEDGRRYFLPDEHQWVAAAAGGEKRKYPWGEEWEDGECNTKESKIEKTSAVGMFKKGDTPEGIADMAGNVWEWTHSDYHSGKVLNDFAFDPEIQKMYDEWLKSSGDEKEKIAQRIISKFKKKDRQLSAVKGGSWYDDKEWNACGARLWYDPLSRDAALGFRCARTL